VDTYSPKAGQAIQVISVFADPTRRKIMLELYKARPTGLTASKLSEHPEINKSIPTILHHLEKLQELNLIYYSMEKIENSNREVKHWKIDYESFLIKIDMQSLALDDFNPDVYIFALFNRLKDDKWTLTEAFGHEYSIEQLKNDLSQKFPVITDRIVQILWNSLQDKTEFLNFVENWIINTFRESGGTLRLDFQEFGHSFSLDDYLRRYMFEKLMASGNFTWDLTEGKQRIIIKGTHLKEE